MQIGLPQGGPMKFIKNKKGQGLIEYLVLVAIMAVATMGVLRVVSQNTSAKFAKISQVLHGRSEGEADNSVQMDSFTDTDVKKKDMSNFFKGSTAHGNSK